MLVYGDLGRIENAGDVCAELDIRLSQCQAIKPGLERHQALVAAFMRASELVQAVADAEFHHIGVDDLSARQDAGNRLLLRLGQTVAESWDSGFAVLPSCMNGFHANFELFKDVGIIATRQAEGYAFYALYPESYIVAARQSGLGPDTLVIGIRSIGAGLGAMVAVGLGAQPGLTVRPVGHPFQRELQLSDNLAARLAGHRFDYAVVDEGPGLSGSSFNCVADWLVAHGVAEDRIHFFPSHAGDLGSAASARHRHRWETARKHIVSFEQLTLSPDNPVHGLKNWIGDLVGPLQEPLQDISGGAWRGTRGADLPADPAMERRKFLGRTENGKWLAKFGGMGSSGEANMALAEALGDAGFSPKPIGLCNGFLVYRWIEAVGTSGELPPIERVLDYLTFRAGLPAATAGAGLEQLFAMAAYNVGERFGEDAADMVRKRLGDFRRFQPVPCCTDNRMHAWEWVRSQSGWLKLDATDHHAAHDLVGCQDIAWDLAGAAVEMDLSEAQRDGLAEELGKQIGRRIEGDFLATMELCYLGFQIGLWTMAQGRNSGKEGQRTERLLRRYGQHRALTWAGIQGTP